MIRAPRRKRPGFTPTQLLLVIALLVFLFGFLFAALFRVRSAAERVTSQNNLKQITLATIKTADDYDGKMPPGPDGWYPGTERAKGQGYGPCLFHILPNMEQKPLYDSGSAKVGDTDITLASLAAGRAVKTFYIKADPTSDPGSDRTSYIANGLAMPETRTRYPASFTDGVSQTIFYAEGYSQTSEAITFGGKDDTWTGERRWWDNPVWFPVRDSITYQVAPPRQAASPRYPQGLLMSGMQVSLGDGSVRNIDRVSATTFYHACTPSDGDVLGSDW